VTAVPVTVGILGAGQLGRMLALSGYPLGLRFRFLDPSPEAPAGPLAELIVAPYDDRRALERLAQGADAVTYEFENVPAAAAAFLASRARVRPAPQALEVAQDRASEKALFGRLGIPTADWAAPDTLADLQAAVARIGLPAMLKTRRLGYDGKGQCLLRRPADAESAWRGLAGAPSILERYVPFDRELSLLAARGAGGEIVFYPLVENHHREGILRLALAPAPHLTSSLQAQAEAHAARVLQALNYVGVLAIEWFERDGRLLANEMAPRVHNSGHWTIEGAHTSQFENHLRAILNLPLGEATPRGYAAMVNLIGDCPPAAAMCSVHRAHVHLYGKTPRPGRKLGHVTLVEPTPEDLRRRLADLMRVVSDR
jgi:5-(carboxyamino)imidazole ribonucleotide synthase